MSSKSDSEVTQLKERVIQLGALLLTKCFPEKIVELNELLDSPMFKEVQRELGTPTLPSTCKVEGHGDGCTDERPVPCSKAVCEMIEVVKPIVRTLIANANLLKMWVPFMIPKREFGDSLGASILEDIRAANVKAQSEAVGYFEAFPKYFVERAKAARIASKYPHMEEYGQAVVEIDERTIFFLQSVVCDVRNFYSSLHDLATKNWDELQNAHSSNTNGYH